MRLCQISGQKKRKTAKHSSVTCCCFLCANEQISISLEKSTLSMARARAENSKHKFRRSLRPFFMRQVYWQRGKHASTVNRACCLSFSLQDKIVLRYRTHGQVCAEGSSGRRVGWGPRMAELSGLKEKQGQIFPYSSGLALPTEALNQALAREVTAAGFF